ncbi:hypothetical protein Q9233_008219 [Columba guinea]|nr:hypothetical protein Q9233_008219 [Columba guinea]
MGILGAQGSAYAVIKCTEGALGTALGYVAFSTAIPEQKPSVQWRRLVQSSDSSFRVKISHLEETPLVWSRDLNPEQRSRSRDPKTSPSAAPRLCSNDRQNCTSSGSKESGDSSKESISSPKERLDGC